MSERALASMVLDGQYLQGTTIHREVTISFHRPLDSVLHRSVDAVFFLMNFEGVGGREPDSDWESKGLEKAVREY